MIIESLKSSFTLADWDQDVPSPWWSRQRTDCSDLGRIRTFHQYEKVTVPSTQAKLKAKRTAALPQIINSTTHMTSTLSKTIPSAFSKVLPGMSMQSVNNNRRFSNIQARYLEPSRQKINYSSHEPSPSPMLKLAYMTDINSSYGAVSVSPQKLAKQRQRLRLVFDPYQL